MALLKSKYLRDIYSALRKVKRVQGDFDRASSGIILHRFDMELGDKILELKKIIEQMRASTIHMNTFRDRLKKASEKLAKKEGDTKLSKENFDFARNEFEKHHANFESVRKQQERYVKKYGDMKQLADAKNKVVQAIHNL